jgi:hypothetical protein
MTDLHRLFWTDASTLITTAGVFAVFLSDKHWSGFVAGKSLEQQQQTACVFPRENLFASCSCSLSRHEASASQANKYVGPSEDRQLTCPWHWCMIISDVEENLPA